MWPSLFFGEELAAIEQQTVAVTATRAPQPVAMDWTPRLALALPLMGFAFYDGTRTLVLLIALVLFSLGRVCVECSRLRPFRGASDGYGGE